MTKVWTSIVVVVAIIGSFLLAAPVIESASSSTQFFQAVGVAASLRRPRPIRSHAHDQAGVGGIVAELTRRARLDVRAPERRQVSSRARGNRGRCGLLVHAHPRPEDTFGSR